MEKPLKIIRQRLARGEYILTVHFLDEMWRDHLFWGDILMAIDTAKNAIKDGCDAEGDPKYRVAGDALDRRSIEIICVIKGPLVFVTVYTLRKLR